MTFLQISRIVQPGNRRSPGHIYLTRRTADGWSLPAAAGGGLSEGAPNFLWFSHDGCYVHYTRDYSEFVRVPLQTVIANLRSLP